MLSPPACASFNGVDHPCEQCGIQVEDGRPFCPQCRAPQVRVEIVPQSLPAESTAPSDARIAADPLHRLAFRASPGSGLFRVALQAGLLGVIANIIPLGLGMVLTGILAALLYHRAAGQTLPSPKAARLGAMAGAVAFAVSSLLTVLAIVFMHAQNQFRDFMIKAVEQHAANPADPQVQAALEWLHSPQGFAVALAFAMIFALVLSMLFSAIGCVIGAVLFRERNRPTF